jgi:hypothetical protein
MAAPWSFKVHILFTYLNLACLCSSVNSGLNTACLSFPLCRLNHRSKLHLFRFIVSHLSTASSRFIWEATSEKVKLCHHLDGVGLVVEMVKVSWVFCFHPVSLTCAATCLLLNMFKAVLFSNECSNCFNQVTNPNLPVINLYPRS